MDRVRKWIGENEKRLERITKVKQGITKVIVPREGEHDIALGRKRPYFENNGGISVR
jgi:hypothetical protein